ncbi:THAP domain-containing protein 9 [Operophtera brumata]|uniref:THAP domain-containing protein 9 n=1 Tax=Operophtera brumata TaxID=104452 RepID=A0A0L7K4H1_OPEBR|nr:THAP domain-containing protein 9 [Operophtera brumata]
MDGVNRRALTILCAPLQQPYITVHNKGIIAFFDPPHLLKCFRNLFMKYDIECSTNISSNDKTGRGKNELTKWIGFKIWAVRANHALLFMVQGLHKKFKQPIAYYFVKETISTEK